MEDKKKSVGGKISFAGFCVACVGLLIAIYINREFGAIIVWIAFFIFIFGMARTWIDMIWRKK
ncbi:MULTISPECIES: hypothetical protein [unclassified Janthinobacterium]|uniref:hypothetical protein n=1 Tax=unclassified Janthinobacterium TaxID=2610881 RepID=UPI0016123858|nr:MULTISPECIES: hypothetical protein [unclassified Janthinobacterium]MBB5368342.1 ABC-type Mn2+/Zn2+ transport system permease subunit [Janthinobacterium sp. K2C7]MBB5382122.1 ABC-type Mn2+/Zn2+ transport system permease subunit [Janthinobacterium sp. K2Li3]MBB5386724.1 ABC-type Mn2+/Zn2+ transport system permease subunit [Janthinobacterium sp. K2E3]